MKCFILFSLCILAQLVESKAEYTVDVFEFGNNVGTVAFTKTGNIGIFEKNVKVPILLQPCMEMRYIRVSVDNKIGPPKVDFDSDVNTVVIKYRRLQYSKSSYTIVAKAENTCQDNLDGDYN